MSFQSCEKQIFNSFGCTEIRKDSKGTKTSRNEVMQTTTTMRLERLIFDYMPIIVGSWNHLSNFFYLNVSGVNRDEVPKQRYDRFPSVGDHIHAATTSEYAWATPRHKEKYPFLRVHKDSNCNI